MNSYVIALDQGTTSSRAIVFDSAGHAVAVANRPLPQHYPHPGWVEHDPEEIFEGQIASLRDAYLKSGVKPSEIAAVGVTNQRETSIVWEKATGKPVYNAIVWQCRRTADFCSKLKSDGVEPYVREKTTPTFPAPNTNGSWTRSPARGNAPKTAAFWPVRWTAT